MQESGAPANGGRAAVFFLGCMGLFVRALPALLLWQLIATGHRWQLKRRRIGSRRQRTAVAMAPALALAIGWVDQQGPAPAGGIAVGLVLLLSQGWALWRLGTNRRG